MSAASIGDWTRQRRKELWLTQKKLARLVGCAPVTIQKIEEGQRRPSPTVAEALARHLEIEAGEVERFLRLAKVSPTPPRAPEPPKAAGGGVPVPLTALIGRESERFNLKELLRHASMRLLTLTGPPGVGKTRLALQVAQDVQPSFADGIYFVPLATLDRSEQVLPSIIRRLGLVDGGAQSRGSRLQAFLSDKRLLLVLDNFEHLLSAAPGLSQLLEHCAGLRALATSRIALGLYGEREWSLEPLPLPGGAQVADNPAVRLFVERVQAFDPNFSLAHHHAAISEIVTRLDGLPLALELAAVRLRYTSAEELAAQLDNQVLGSLGTGPTDRSERQRTLHGAIAWSYERLEERLKRIYRHMGVFIGGFDAAAASSICEARATDLHTLMDGHLIQRDGERYTLFETLREYSLEQLKAHQELESARDLHLEYFWSTAQARRPDKPDLDWYEAEIGNCRAALQRALDQSKTKQASQLIWAMDWFWQTRGYQREGLEWVTAALLLPSEVDPEDRVLALNRACTLAWQTGAFELAPPWLAEGLALSRRSGRIDLEVIMLQMSGKVALEQGLHEESLRVLEQALALCRVMNTQPVAHKANPTVFEVNTEQAPYYSRNFYHLCASLWLLSDVQLAVKNYEKAQLLAEKALAICRTHSGLFWEPVSCRVLGEVALEREDFKTAQSFLSQSLRLAMKLEHKLMLTDTLADFSACLVGPKATEAELLRATRLWGAVEAVREINGYQWSPADAARIGRHVEQARGRVPDLEWNLAWIGGRSMTLEEALSYALAPEKYRVNH